MRLWGIILWGALGLIAPAAASANGDITGTVTEQAGGTTLGNFQVEAYLVGAAAPTASTCTLNDGSGNYSLSVPAATYEVKFAGGSGGGCTPASAYAPEWWNSHGPRAFADPITVTDGGTAPNKNASVQLGAEVSGTVTAGGAPLANVTVDLIDADGTIPATACTAADGTYLMNRLNGGAFTARFTANGVCGNAGNYQTLWYNQSTTQAGATSINIGAPGEIVTGINAQMSAPPPGPFTLTVTKSGTGTGGVLSVPAGIDCGAICSAPFAGASAVSLAANPTGGSTFTGWSGGGCSGTGSCTVTMNAAQTVDAAFAAGGGGGGGGGGAGGGGGGDAERPDTKIDSSKIKAKKGKASFSFSGSGGTAPLEFECLLAGKTGSPGYHDCSSPVTYKKLRKGRYTFFVRARGADGGADSSPATQVFKSKRKKRK